MYKGRFDTMKQKNEHVLFSDNERTEIKVLGGYEHECF